MRRSCAGVTLLESLIAILIFAIGFIGLAALQLKSMQLSESSFQKHQAIALAQDMADRLASNATAITADGYLGTATQNLACIGQASPNTCTENQLAQHELFEWQTVISQRLPNSASAVCRDSSPQDGLPGSTACSASASSDTPVVIKIWWQAASDQSVQLYTLSLGL